MKIRHLLLGCFAVGASVMASWAQSDQVRQAVNPDHLPDMTQYGFSQAVVVSSDTRIVYVSGQIGATDAGPNDFQSQVDRAFANLGAVLKAAGTDMKHVTKITLLVKNNNQAKLQYLVRKRREAFGDSPPASTLIPVQSLALDSFEFEIDAIAVLPK